MSQPVLDLFESVEEQPQIAARCFYWGKCQYVERGVEPQVVHDAMEAHYAARHSADIDESFGIMGRVRSSPDSETTS